MALGSVSVVLDPNSRIGSLIAGYTEICRAFSNVPAVQFDTYNVVRGKQRSLVGIIMRNLQQHDAACDGWEAQQCQDRALHLPNCRQPCATHRGDKLNCAKGNVEQHSMVRAQAERLDDQRAERGDAAAWNPRIR